MHMHAARRAQRQTSRRPASSSNVPIQVFNPPPDRGTSVCEPNGGDEVLQHAPPIWSTARPSIYARQGVNLDRSTLADWVGRAAFLLRPVHERLLAILKSSTKLFADETTAPVLDPGRGRTKTGQLFAYARDDRPWGGTDPPAVAYVYAPDRKAARPITHLDGFVGVLQVDGYGGYRVLAERNAVTLAFCRVGGDVASPAPHRPGRADFPHPVLHAQASLTEQHIDGRSSQKAVGVERAWFGSASTANCCAALAA